MADAADRVKRIARRAVGRGAEPAPQPTRTSGADPSEGLSPDAKLLFNSPLFDLDFYRRQTGNANHDRRQAVLHYLERGLERDFHPNPLFDSAYFLRQFPQYSDDDIEEKNPLAVYLRRSAWRIPTHPLFDTKGYLKRNPEARQHRAGPIGHYLETGRLERSWASRWLPADGEEGNPDDIRQDDITAWMQDRHDEWRVLKDATPQVWADRLPRKKQSGFRQRWADAAPPSPQDERPLVTVVIQAGLEAEHLATSLATLTPQTLTDWDAIVLTTGEIEGLAALLEEHLAGKRYEVRSHTSDEFASAMGSAVADAAGTHIAFLDAADRWDPDRLRLLTVFADTEGHTCVADGVEGLSFDGSIKYALQGQESGPVLTRAAVELPRLLVRADALAAVHAAGGFDDGLPGAWEFDVAVRLLAQHDIVAAPVVGIERTFRDRASAHRLPPSRRNIPDQKSVAAWADVVLLRTLIDWEASEARTPTPGLTSVLIPTYRDYSLTLDAVEAVMAAAEQPDAAPVEVIVWDNGSTANTSVVLDALALRYEQVTVHHSASNHGFALGNDLALAHATGDVVVFLNNDTEVPHGWTDPLREALEDPEVLAAQSLLLFPGGSVQSAGVAFPSTGGIPHAYLAQFPIEDTVVADLENLRFNAITGAAFAVRYEDAVAMRGFDPIFTNGMEDLDLCHRLQQAREGHFKVCTAKPVVHHESATEGRYENYMLNRELYLDRWRGVCEPRDDEQLWAAAGISVLDHEVRVHSDWQKRRLMAQIPIMMRTERLQLTERDRPLRWAIKNPAPPFEAGEHWGDTHFARALASALRERGEEVVIDARPEFERPTSRHDDVALVLRGLAPFRPTFEQVSICWLISHPEMLGRPEATTYDQVLAASIPWARDTSAAWGIDIQPLLQATDPGLFHPDLARPDTGHPVLFVGSSRNIERPVVRDAVEAGLPLSVYGGGWNQFIDQRFIKGTYFPNTELGAAYRSAGVVLNDHWADMAAKGFLSNRLFDAVGAGARVISDHVEGLAEIFGDAVQVWETPEDLTRLSSSYEPDAIFGSDEQRRETAARIHEEHSFGARADQLMAMARELRSRRGFTR